MAAERVISINVVKRAQAAIAALDSGALETSPPSMRVLAGVLRQGVSLLLEHGHRVPVSPSEIFYATDPVSVGDCDFFQLSGTLPESQPPVGQVNLRVQSYHRRGGEDNGRFTIVTVWGEIRSNNNVTVDPASLEDARNAHIRPIVIFAKAALPSKRGR